MTGRWARDVLGTVISRRAFLKATGTVAIMAAAGTPGCTGTQGAADPTLTPIPAATGAPSRPSGKIVVATDEDPAKLVDKALDAFGGLAGVIKSGDKVLIKANYSFARKPEQGACNHPEVLVQIARRCKAAGASEVLVLDYTIDSSEYCLEQSKIRSTLKAAGFNAVAVKPGDFVEQDFKCGNVTENIKVPRQLLDADVLINAPVIKSHGNTRLTAGMKNLMGLIYNRNQFHAGQLDQCIADLAKQLPPNLVIADAYRVLKTNGPNGGGADDLIEYPHQVVVGDDIVAVDAYAAGYIGLKPEDVAHVRIAHEMGLGEIDPAKLNLIKV